MDMRFQQDIKVKMSGWHLDTKPGARDGWKEPAQGNKEKKPEHRGPEEGEQARSPLRGLGGKNPVYLLEVVGRIGRQVAAYQPGHRGEARLE